MRNRALGFGIAAGVFALDQMTKWFVLGPLRLREVQVVELLPFFRFWYTENNGISLGLLECADRGRALDAGRR